MTLGCALFSRLELLRRAPQIGVSVLFFLFAFVFLQSAFSLRSLLFLDTLLFRSFFCRNTLFLLRRKPFIDNFFG